MKMRRLDLGAEDRFVFVRSRGAEEKLQRVLAFQSFALNADLLLARIELKKGKSSHGLLRRRRGGVLCNRSTRGDEKQRQESKRDGAHGSTSVPTWTPIS